MITDQSRRTVAAAQNTTEGPWQLSHETTQYGRVFQIVSPTTPLGPYRAQTVVADSMTEADARFILDYGTPEAVVQRAAELDAAHATLKAMQDQLEAADRIAQQAAADHMAAEHMVDQVRQAHQPQACRCGVEHAPMCTGCTTQPWPCQTARLVYTPNLITELRAQLHTQEATND